MKRVRRSSDCDVRLEITSGESCDVRLTPSAEEDQEREDRLSGSASAIQRHPKDYDNPYERMDRDTLMTLSARELEALLREFEKSLALHSPGEYYESLPPEPTETLPGSAERIAVLRERARQNQTLDHPHDVRIRRLDGSPDLGLVIRVGRNGHPEVVGVARLSGGF